MKTTSVALELISTILLNQKSHRDVIIMPVRWSELLFGFWKKNESRLIELKNAIDEGMKSGRAEDFDPNNIFW